MQDKDELQKKVCEQLKQLSVLRAQVSEVTLTTTSHSVVDTERPTHLDELRLRLEELTNTLQVRDKEVSFSFLFFCADTDTDECLLTSILYYYYDNWSNNDAMLFDAWQI